MAHPFDRRKVKELQLTSEHHSTCLHTKVASTVGLGFLTEKERAARLAMEEGGPAPGGAPGAPPPTPPSSVGGSWKLTKVNEVLNPLCDQSFQDVLNAVAEDFWQDGDGYMEVVRSEPGADGFGKITGLHYIPAEDAHIYVEDVAYNRHWEIDGGPGGTRRFAEFGDIAELRARAGASTSTTFQIDANDRLSEVIQFRRPTSLHRLYGFPDYLSCVPAIELIQCLRQYKYDFFNNRGVPEFFLWVTGVKLDEKDWKKVTEALNATVGRGNSHKSLAMNIDNPNVTIQLDQLGVQGKSDDSLDKTNETYQLAIVTAHGVPPLLAGILIPGKLGSTNELPNALKAFQALRIGQAQLIFQQRLGMTLGDPKRNGGLGLTMDDFTFRRITDEIDMKAMDTSTRMRQTEPAAAAAGRNLSAGVKH